jgi:hypothetical protein
MDKVRALYATDGTEAEDKTIHLHYFSASTDLYVAELEQREEDGHWIAFGYSALGSQRENAEWGYTDLTELEAVNARSSQGLPLLVERDCWWNPQPFRDVQAARNDAVSGSRTRAEREPGGRLTWPTGARSWGRRSERPGSPGGPDDPAPRSHGWSRGSAWMRTSGRRAGRIGEAVARRERAECRRLIVEAIDKQLKERDAASEDDRPSWMPRQWWTDAMDEAAELLEDPEAG